MKNKDKLNIYLGILLGVIGIGYFLFFYDPVKEDNKNIDEQQKILVNAASYDMQKADSILAKGVWDLLENNIEGLLSERVNTIDLTDYRIVSVEPVNSWTAGEFTGGTVDIVMAHREQFLYDWLSIDVILSGEKLIHASVHAPDYYKESFHIVSVPEELISEFIDSTFDTMNLTNFGYRYRTQLELPEMKWTVHDKKIVGQYEDLILVNVQYSVHYADSTKNLTALLLLRYYEGKKLQIEDLKVV